MIHVKTQVADLNDNPVLHISLVGTADIQKFRSLLGRALNCAPEFGADWFTLADRVDQFLAVHDVPVVSS